MFREQVGGWNCVAAPEKEASNKHETGEKRSRVKSSGCVLLYQQQMKTEKQQEKKGKLYLHAVRDINKNYDLLRFASLSVAFSQIFSPPLSSALAEQFFIHLALFCSNIFITRVLG